MNKTTDTGLIEVEELLSFTYGKCTLLKISPEIKGLIQINNVIRLNFKSQNEENLPIVKVFYTSRSNSVGAMWHQWHDGKVYELTMKPQDKIYYSLSLSRQIRKKLPEKSHCSLDMGYYECLGQR